MFWDSASGCLGAKTLRGCFGQQHPDVMGTTADCKDFSSYLGLSHIPLKIGIINAADLIMDYLLI